MGKKGREESIDEIVEGETMPIDKPVGQIRGWQPAMPRFLHQAKTDAVIKD